MIGASEVIVRLVMNRTPRQPPQRHPRRGLPVPDAYGAHLRGIPRTDNQDKAGVRALARRWWIAFHTRVWKIIHHLRKPARLRRASLRRWVICPNYVRSAWRGN